MQIVTERDGEVRPGHRMPKGLKNPLWWGVGERLRALGLGNRLTQTRIAALAGVTKTTVSNIESLEHAPRIDVVERIAAALAISPTWLAFGEQGHVPFRQRYPRPVLPGELPEIAPASRTPAGLADGFGARLKTARAARGLSAEKLAAKIRDSELGTMTGQAIRDLEPGGRMPTVSACWLLAWALDVSPGWLAYGEGEGIDDVALGRS